MRSTLCAVALLAATCGIVLPAAFAQPIHYIGLSLGRGSAAARAAGDRLQADRTLGMTDVVGFAVDRSANDDIVIIGQRRTNGRVLTPDDVAQLLRAASRGGLTGPGISLEPMPGDTNRLEAVYFGDSGASFIGRVSFDGDLLLKEVALGFKPDGLAGLRSYADRLLEEMAHQRAGTFDVLSRFWFAPAYMPVFFEDDCWVLGSPKVAILVENIRCTIDGIPQTNRVDRAAESFATEAMGRFGELAARNRAFADVKAMMGSLQIAGLIVQHGSPDGLRYWLREYQARPVDCPTGTAFLRRSVASTGSSLTVFGGVRAAGLAVRLSDRKVSAIRTAVLAARPAHMSVVAWEVKTDDDGIPTSANLPERELRAARNFVHGLRLRETRRFLEASIAFEESAKAATDPVQARFLAALCRREAMTAAGQVQGLEASLVEFRGLASENPAFPEISYELGVTLAMTGANGEAASLFDKVMEESPGFGAAVYAAGLSFYRLGNKELAKTRFRNYLGLSSTGPLSREARRMLNSLEAPGPTSEPKLHEAGRFSCWYPADWKVVTRNAASQLLRDAPTSSTVEVAFISPSNPDCNIVISTKPVPAARPTPGQMETALSKAEQSLRSRNAGFHRLLARVIEHQGVPGLQILFTSERLGRPYRQRVTTYVGGGVAITVTCSAPESDFQGASRVAFALTDDIQLEPLRTE